MNERSHQSNGDLVRYLDRSMGADLVCVSRAKRLVYLLVEPMPFDRLSKLGDKLTLNIRLQEEMRLKALAVEILLRNGCNLLSHR